MGYFFLFFLSCLEWAKTTYTRSAFDPQVCMISRLCLKSGDLGGQWSSKLNCFAMLMKTCFVSCRAKWLLRGGRLRQVSRRLGSLYNYFWMVTILMILVVGGVIQVRDPKWITMLFMVSRHHQLPAKGLEHYELIPLASPLSIAKYPQKAELSHVL